MKLYIDQEPRRTQILPELCKVVHVSEQEVLGGIFHYLFNILKFFLKIKNVVFIKFGVLFVKIFLKEMKTLRTSYTQKKRKKQLFKGS